jgi:hypothetical protein
MKETKVTLAPLEWEKIVNYIKETPIDFQRASQAVEIASIIVKAKWYEISTAENE